MTGWLLALVAALAGAVAYLWERNGRLGAERDLKHMSSQAADAYRQFRDEQLARALDVQRRESVIARLKREIALLEEDVDACSSPAAVRDRLRRLLAVPSGDADSASAVLLPHSSAA
jgi:hypothetical protein